MTTEGSWLGLMCKLCFNEYGPLTYENAMEDEEGKWDVHQSCHDKDLENGKRIRAERKTE